MEYVKIYIERYNRLKDAEELLEKQTPYVVHIKDNIIAKYWSTSAEEILEEQKKIAAANAKIAEKKYKNLQEARVSLRPVIFIAFAAAAVGFVAGIMSVILNV